MTPSPRLRLLHWSGLWGVHFTALRKYLAGARTPAAIYEKVTADVDAAAELIRAGLGGLLDPGPGGYDRSLERGARAEPAGVVDGVQDRGQTALQHPAPDGPSTNLAMMIPSMPLKPVWS